MYKNTGLLIDLNSFNLAGLYGCRGINILRLYGSESFNVFDDFFENYYPRRLTQYSVIEDFNQLQTSLGGKISMTFIPG